MVIYGLVRGGPAHWHPLRLSRQLAEAYVAPRATRCAIFKMPGLHPKYSVLYFWCEMIFLGGGCRDFFFFHMKHMGLGSEAVRETAGYDWKRGTQKKGGGRWWPRRSHPEGQLCAHCCCQVLIANGLLMDQESKRPGFGLQLGFIEDTGGLCICLK